MPLPLIRDPVQASIMNPLVIRNPTIEPEPERSTVYATSTRRQAPTMRLGPGQAEVFQLPLADSEDAPQILAYLHSLAMQFGQAPYIREFTVNVLLRGDFIGDNEQSRQIETVLNFVRRSMTYVRDPVDSEYVISPVNLIGEIQAGRQAYGDCEDHCLLLASMLSSIGFPTRFIATRINGSDWWNHVILSVYLDGRWFDLDPIAKGIMQPEYYTRMVGETNYGS